MSSSRIGSLAAVALLALAGGATAGGERVTFELPDMDGTVVRSSDLTSRYALLVYQGMP